ncbi:MAG: glycosyltransferase family 4 protein [Ruminococcaceae bacterium]|nr:glycosyltransferase family 4 protein [Oscillospiraceae bacterium]
MKVILLAPTPPPAGGIAGWTVRMMNSALKNGWSVEVVDEKLGEGRELFGSKKKKSFFAEVKRCFRIWNDLKKKLNDDEAAVVHSCIPSYTLSMIREYVCACITKRRKRKFILHFRCTVPNSVKGRVSRFVFKRICNKSDRIFLLNQQSVDFTKKLTNTPIELIPNFVDSSEIAESKEIKEKLTKAVYVGGVIETKGCANVIELAKAYPDIKFTFVGSPSASIKALAEGVDNVELVGPKEKSEVKAILADSDVFVFLSYFLGEGFSNALAEAMAMGLPCLVTDWAANADMIENKGGFVVPIKDTSAAIEALKKMLPHEVRASQSAFNLEKTVRVYSDKAVLSQYVDAYERTINVNIG